MVDTRTNEEKIRARQGKVHTFSEAIEFEKELDRGATSNVRPVWVDAKTGKRVSIGYSGK